MSLINNFIRKLLHLKRIRVEDAIPHPLKDAVSAWRNEGERNKQA